MISVSIHGLTVTGSNEKEFAFAMKQAQAVSELVKSLGAVSAPMARQASEARADDYCAQWLASELNKGKAPNWIPQSRYRMTTEEIAEHGEGESARQESAKARLIAGGLITGKGEAVEGATSADVEASGELASEFD